jgi:arginase family enzyme
MAFRRLIETGALDPKRFAVAGLGRFVNDESHLRWLSKQSAELIFADQLLTEGLPVQSLLRAAFGASKRITAHRAGRNARAAVNAGFVSIDLDAIDSSAAPGVSALNPLGLGVGAAAALAEAAGADPRVRHFDIMELSPPHDPSGRTARIAALLFLQFVAGFRNRPL